MFFELKSPCVKVYVQRSHRLLFERTINNVMKHWFFLHIDTVFLIWKLTFTTLTQMMDAPFLYRISYMYLFSENPMVWKQRIVTWKITNVLEVETQLFSRSEMRFPDAVLIAVDRKCSNSFLFWDLWYTYRYQIQKIFIKPLFNRDRFWYLVESLLSVKTEYNRYITRVAL